jgi:diamine N-acetyltransferase
MEIRIRHATPGDYDELCTLFDQVDALHREHLPHIFRKPVGPVRDREYLLGLMADEHVGMLVARLEERIVGVAQVFVRDTPPLDLLVPRRVAVVEDVVVGSQFRHRGVGQALMQAAHRWAADLGATTIELNVYEFNRRASEFYRQLGYQTLSRTMVRDLQDRSSTAGTDDRTESKDPFR